MSEYDFLSSKTPALSPQMLALQKSLARGKSVIGIDIGISSVSAVQSAVYNGKPTIIKTAVENIGFVNEQEREEATIEALGRAMSNFNTKNADIVCTVSNQKTIVDYMTMPVMPDAELAEAVKIEVKNSEYFSMEDPIIDYQVIGKTTDKGVEKINVMVAVVARSSVHSLLSYFKPLKNNHISRFKKFLLVSDFMGLNLIKAVPISIALENIIKKSKHRMKETIATLEIGSMAAELNIYSDGCLEFSRKISITGLDFTRCLTSALFTNTGKTELTLQEAEWVKKEYGIPSAGEEFLIQGKITANQAISLLRPRLEQLIREIARSFDFYYDKNHFAKIDRLVLFGGGSMLKRLPEFLNMELGLPVGLGNPLQDVEVLCEGLINSMEDTQKMTLAIGASLADAQGINLLPERLRDSKKKFFENLLGAGLSIAVVLLSILLYVLMWVQLDGLKNESQKSHAVYQSMVPQIKDIEDKMKLQKLIDRRVDGGALLRELSYVPGKVYLTSFKLDNRNISLSGFAEENARDARKILFSWIADLKKSSLRDIKVVTLKEEKKSMTSFTLKAKLDAAGDGS